MKTRILVVAVGLFLGILIGTIIGDTQDNKEQTINKGQMIVALDAQVSPEQLEQALKIYLTNSKDKKMNEHDWALDIVVRYLLKEKLYEEYQFEKYRQQSK